MPLYAPSALFITNHIFCSTAGMVRSLRTCRMTHAIRIPPRGPNAPLPPAPAPAPAAAPAPAPADLARVAVICEASQSAKENKLIIISDDEE